LVKEKVSVWVQVSEKAKVLASDVALAGGSALEMAKAWATPRRLRRRRAG
jgi:hypothetical protein